ncbi:insulinase family protein [filamentous cyanobacterium LEGE 11480]|uniref:Insulinase family protein n=1 Tax=Romeriopsis navalis LEGE 11480 TaxID=2777977 RepID=A0A928VK67_9CYAN|nr:pitrilysin family protein [Romeriopsis navalis]MBE9029243.1 insulinase family protein [Romeriopsis navalis LEGE 11480]
MDKNQEKRIAQIITVTVTLLLIPALLLLMSVWPAHADVGQPKHYTELKFPPLPEIQVPKYDRFTLKNGIVVYLMEDKELPLVSGTAMIRTGERFEAADQTGLADVMATVMRSGGTKAHPSEQLNQILEQKAASIEAGMSVNAGSAGFSALSEDLPQVLDLFAEVLQQPAFPEDKLNLAKVQIQGGIARRNDSASDIMRREFRKLIYGETSPYGRTVEYATLDKINRQDLVDFYQTWYRPENLILGIVGDFDAPALKAQLAERFGSWQADTPKPRQPRLPLVRQRRQDGVYLVNQPQLNQSSIRLGHLGGFVGDYDYPTLAVMNEVLSSFGGRLFNEIRSRQGLAYSVYAAWSPQFDYQGVFLAGGDTRSAATVPFVKSLKKEIERIRQELISETELKAAKDAVLNSFIFNFQKPAQTLSRLMRYEYFGYPPDFIFTYQKGIENATIADVQRVAQKYLAPDKIVTIVVGNEAAIKPSLSELGKVREIDVTIPKPTDS